MPVNLNPPPLPTPETVRGATAGAAADPDAPEAGLFAQLLAATETPFAAAAATLLPSALAADRDESESAADAPADPAAPTLVDWAGLGFAPMPMPATVATETPNAAKAPSVGASATAVVPAELDRAAATAFVPAELDRAAAKPKVPTDNERATTLASVADAGPRLTGDVPRREQLPATASSRGAQSNAARESGHAPEPLSAAETGDDRSGFANLVRASEVATPRPGAALTAVGESGIGDARGRRAGETSGATLPTVIAASAPPPPPLLADPVRVITVTTPVGNPGWNQELTGKLAQVVLRNESVEIRLSPAELGPIDIRVDLRADQASVTILAAHPATRDALEQALPQLRETLAAQGIALGQASVQDGRRQPSAEGRARWAREHGGTDAGAIAALPDPRSVRARTSLIDTFA